MHTRILATAFDDLSRVVTFARNYLSALPERNICGSDVPCQDAAARLFQLLSSLCIE